jgi:hypothetical protein
VAASFYNSILSVGTSAYMQALATALFGSFADGGLIQTADTGQTANGSFAAVGAINTAAGYQIWRFNDALQATRPVFIKFEIGSGGNNSACPGTWITVGTGSDGAGNITGILLGRTPVRTNFNAPGTYASYFSCGPSRVGVALWAPYQNPSYCPFVTLERSKDNNGADTDDGLIFNASGFDGRVCQYIPFARAARAAQGAYNVCMQTAAGSLASGTNVGLLPAYPLDAAGPVSPGLEILGYYCGDLAAFNPISTAIYGTYHTYIPLGGAASTAGAAWTGSGIAMLYE